MATTPPHTEASRASAAPPVGVPVWVCLVLLCALPALAGGVAWWVHAERWAVLGAWSSTTVAALAAVLVLVGSGVMALALLGMTRRSLAAARAAAAAAQASERRHVELFQRSPSALVIHRDLTILTVNDAAARLFGHDDAQELVGRSLLSLYQSEYHDIARERARQIASEGGDRELPLLQIMGIRRDGGRIHIAGTGVRVMLADGPAIETTYVDLDDRLQSGRALLQSEAVLSRLFTHSLDCITLTDIETGRYLRINPAYTRVTGYTNEDVIGRTSFEIDIWADPAHRASFVEAIRRDGSVHDMPVIFRVKDGRLLSMLISGATFAYDGRDCLVLTARDVTQNERERLEFAAILENASVGIALTRDRTFQRVNRRFEEMFGWLPGTLAGQPGSVVWMSDDDYRQIGETAGPRLAQGLQVEIERPMRRRDGSHFWARGLGQAVDPHRPADGGTVWIIEDISERRRAAQDLAAARDQAEAASRAKSAFLTNMSHEIRTPLHGVLGLATLALEPGTGAERKQAYLRSILDSARTLSGVISEILDLAKIEAGRLTLEHEPFDLHEALQSVAGSYEALARDKGLALHLHVAPGVARVVMGDALRVRQILGNFLSNALKFTPSGRIDLRVEATAGALVRFSVIDTGPGIDAATRARLFQPFMQADDSITRRFGGSGLGLSICRELALLMGGSTGVHSEPGQGSTFWALLPLPLADRGVLEAPQTLDTTPLRGARVLVVEDNPVNMLIATATLEGWGVDVAQAVDGRDALAQVEAASGRFDVVLMDVQMPDLSGYEVTQQIRATYGPQELPIIALTAAAMVSERERTRDVGMNDFLSKPIDAQRLKALLLRWVGRRRVQGAPLG